MQKHIILLVTFLITTLHVQAQSTHETAYDPGEILLISSYNSETPYIYSQISEFQRLYKEQGGKFSISIEELNCDGMSECEEWVSRLDTIMNRHLYIQALILIGAEANIAFCSSAVESYRNIPVYSIMTPLYVPTLPQSKTLTALKEPSKGYRNLKSVQELLTGYNVRFAYLYQYNVENEMRMIRNIYPDRKTFAVISDNSISGLGLGRLYRHYFDKHPEFAVRYIDGQVMSMSEAIEAYNSLNAGNTVGLLCNWRITRLNERYISNAFFVFKDINPQLPVFSLTGTGIGYWAVGGCIPRYENTGKTIATRIYHELEENIHMQPEIRITHSCYRFDQQELDAHKIPHSVLPENAEILNKPITTHDLIHKYKAQIIMGIIIILLTISICAGAIVHGIHSRRISKKLKYSEMQLQHEKRELARMNKDLQKAVKRAEEANQLKNNFVANISHEIRTPLNAITGFAEILTEKIEDKGCKDYVAIIQHNSDLLLKLINDILNISKLESNTDKLELFPYNIADYCQSWIQEYRGKKEDVEIQYRSTETEIKLVTDIRYLQQLVINLMDNAIKFTPKGYVELALRKDEEGVTLTVTDTGPGIPEERQEDIFERFVKLDYYIQGTGLGLSICRLVAERLQGNIKVDNNYKGGARFVVFLPWLKAMPIK